VRAPGGRSRTSKSVTSTALVTCCGFGAAKGARTGRPCCRRNCWNCCAASGYHAAPRLVVPRRARTSQLSSGVGHTTQIEFPLAPHWARGSRGPAH
jgi:hypothetical protein